MTIKTIEQKEREVERERKDNKSYRTERKGGRVRQNRKR